MNKDQELEIKRRLRLLCILCFLVLYAVYCFVISPLRISAANDVVLADTVIPSVLQYAGSLMELVAISVSYAVMIFAFYKFGAFGARWTGAIFIVATACKYTANVTMGWITQGSISSGWIWEIINIAFYTALESIQFLIVYSISKHIIFRNKIYSGTTYPFEKVYDKSNPLLRSGFWCAVVTVVAKVVGRVVNDMWSIILYGPPEKPETGFLMLITYAANIILGLICYFVIYLILDRILMKHT